MKIHAVFMGLLLATWFLSVAVRSASESEYMVIVNDQVAVEQLDVKTVQAIFLGEKTQWANGDRIVTVILESGSIHELFMKEILRKTPMQFTTYWNQQLFTGKGIPPHSFATIEQMIDFVSKTRGAIGYVPSSAIINNFKVVKIVE